MGRDVEPRGVIVNVCRPMLEFLERNGVVKVVADDAQHTIVYEPAHDADYILRTKFPEPEPEEE